MDLVKKSPQRVSMEKERTREKDQKSDRHKILLHVSATAPNKNGVTEGIVLLGWKSTF